ncbi:MAG: SGNH/GDSL hydrolase family protein [Caldilineaceae bacterium]
MPQTILPSDTRLTWSGALSLETGDGWMMPWGIHHEQAALFCPGLRKRAAMPAGVRITFRSDTRSLGGHILPVPDMSPIDLYYDGIFSGSVNLAGRSDFHFSGLPSGGKAIELWLPQFGGFRLRAVVIDAEAILMAFKDERPRWITYGSSITQCRTAFSPSRTWPAIVARERGYNLTALGYGGQCHLDVTIARMIRDMPVDFLSICVGINIYGSGSLNERSFGQAVIGFVQLLREGHPQTPLVVMSPIHAVHRETEVNSAGFTIQAMREEVEKAVAVLQAQGDDYIHYVNGLDIFGADSAHLLPDDLHPNGEGYELMGRNFSQKVADRYFV